MASNATWIDKCPCNLLESSEWSVQRGLEEICISFFYDTSVYSSSWKAHLEHVEIVLRILQKEKLYAKLSKCSFGIREVDYLRHTITRNGDTIDKNKVLAVKEWPISTNLKQLRGFLGLTGYYKRFINGYASLASPLTNLQKKDAFK